jgi:hypothetical protein
MGKGAFTYTEIPEWPCAASEDAGVGELVRGIEHEENHG